MKKYSLGQLKALSDFFNTVAAAWFTVGIVTPFFAKASFSEKVSFLFSGFVFSYFFLKVSLFFVKGIEK